MVNPPAKGLSLEIAVKAAEAIADLETERRELNKTLATDARALTQKSARSVPGINLALNSEGKTHLGGRLRMTCPSWLGICARAGCPSTSFLTI